MMGSLAPRSVFGSRILRGSAAFLAAVFAAILVGALALGGAALAGDPTDARRPDARPEALKGNSDGDGTAENPYVVPVLGFWVRGLLAVALVAPGALATVRARRESDFPTSRGTREPTATRLRKDFEALQRRISPIIGDRKNMTHLELVERLEALAPWAPPEKIEEAANAGPVGAAHVLLGCRYDLGRNAFRKRMVQVKKRS